MLVYTCLQITLDREEVLGGEGHAERRGHVSGEAGRGRVRDTDSHTLSAVRRNNPWDPLEGALPRREGRGANATVQRQGGGIIKKEPKH